MTAGDVKPWNGSAGISVRARTPVTRAPAKTSASSASSPSSGANHAAYQGSRYGIDSARSKSVTPQAAAGTAGSEALMARARRHTRTANRKTNAASTATAALVPALDPANEPTTACAARPTRCEGLAHASTPPRVVNGASVCHPARNGVADTSIDPATKTRWAVSVRTRWARSLWTSHHSQRASAGTRSVLTRHAAVRSSVTANALTDAARGRVTAIAAAPASGAAISASTWAPPTVCTTSTGLRPTSAAASDARSGLVRVAARAAKPVAAAIARPVRSLNAKTVAPGDPANVRAIAALSRVNRGP